MYIKIILFLLANDTQSIFENLSDEDEVVFSDCDDVDKDPNYVPVNILDTSIDQLCTAEGI